MLWFHIQNSLSHSQVEKGVSYETDSCHAQGASRTQAQSTYLHTYRRAAPARSGTGRCIHREGGLRHRKWRDHLSDKFHCIPVSGRFHHHQQCILTGHVWQDRTAQLAHAPCIAMGKILCQSTTVCHSLSHCTHTALLCSIGADRTACPRTLRESFHPIQSHLPIYQKAHTPFRGNPVTISPRRHLLQEGSFLQDPARNRRDWNRIRHADHPICKNRLRPLQLRSLRIPLQNRLVHPLGSESCTAYHQMDIHTPLLGRHATILLVRRVS